MAKVYIVKHKMPTDNVTLHKDELSVANLQKCLEADFMTFVFLGGCMKMSCHLPLTPLDRISKNQRGRVSKCMGN